jgi:hypothetical protein
VTEPQRRVDVRTLHGVVGASLPRTDAHEKVTGRAVCITDLRIPGMVHAKLWHRPLPHTHDCGVPTPLPVPLESACESCP